MAVTLSISLFACSSEGGKEEDQSEPPVSENPETGVKSTVYITSDISPEGLLAVYQALGRKATGRVAVKLSTGEPGGHNYLQPSLISDLVHEVNGTIVECNTATEADAPTPPPISVPPKTMASPPLPKWTSWIPRAKPGFRWKADAT